MEKTKYQKLVAKHTPKPKKLQNAFIAFLVGGLIGLLAELTTNFLVNVFVIPIKDAIIWTLIIFVALACLFTALNFFDEWVMKAKAGIIIPITGFAHSITSAVLDYKKDGIVTGIGTNFFKLAGGVLAFGTISAFVLAILKAVIIWLQ